MTGRSGLTKHVQLLGCTAIDSTGLKLLADLHRQGRRFVLVAPTSTIQKILGIVGLDALLPVAASVEDALNVLCEES